MKLSKPVYKLKYQAKILAREQHIPHSTALDIIAAQEGFKTWSLLSAQLSVDDPSSQIFSQINPGDLVLIGARPGQGKTMMGLRLILNAASSGTIGWFFSLEWNMPDILERAQKIGVDINQLSNRFKFDNSDQISAEYIIQRLMNSSHGTLVAIDYLQLLDQDRRKPNIAAQVKMLKEYAQTQGVIFIFISQIDRSYDLLSKPFPDIEDIRLPNPLDLTLFDKACFINNGEAIVSSIS